MARSTRSLVVGATFGWPLTTLDTVWCETPACAATSAMPIARGGPSGSTVAPHWGRPRRRPPSVAPEGPSARRAGATLVVDVEGDGQQQDEALDDRLDGLVDALQLHAVAQDGDEQ